MPSRVIMTGMIVSAYYRNKLVVSSQGGSINGGPHQLERPSFFIMPQGRCAETLLRSTMSSMLAERTREKVSPTILSNTFFDTTGTNAAVAGFGLQTFTQPGLGDHFPQNPVGRKNLFKGNMDFAATETYLDAHLGQVAMILMTITNNQAAAQSVSMANIRNTAALANSKKKFKKNPFSSVLVVSQRTPSSSTSMKNDMRIGRFLRSSKRCSL
ncbi:hypothetical protein CC80DRAFT_583492 [Byssothecium circinans]|uniref:Aromatic amino acid beta-eliminating lyase/threonine aldolase domain-containing protein n=1 Tax=Byssothecium circinans TaxID=147558 RepID=A0A6A5T9G0_9PLEO|nr:hypothetical protein CC80DRAFT_583492 [Byssothecium circinans]